MADTIFRLFLKNWYPITVISLIFIIFYSLNTHREILMSRVLVPPEINMEVRRFPKTSTSRRPSTVKTNRGIKYILLWTNPDVSPFIYFEEGRNIFLSKSCTYTNCYVTSDRKFLGDYTEFEVIAFNGPELSDYKYMNDLPKRRFEHQKYVYANIESAGIYPVCTNVWDGFFNWTWTYKLDSSAVWGYFVIRDMKNNIVGPKTDMHWIDKMDPIDDKLKVSLSSKTRPIAWFVSNCNTASLRENFVRQVQDHLRDYNLDVDIYGECGNIECNKTTSNECFKLLEKKYFFYLAFENSISDDYVTEKLLNALNHNTVPIVFGGANYTRFLPNGSYLDAQLLGPKKLAQKIFELLHNLHDYFEFFKWKKYYSYHRTDESPDSDVYCKFCAMLNDEKLFRTTSIYEDFKLWWTPEARCRDNLNVTLGLQNEAGEEDDSDDSESEEVEDNDKDEDKTEEEYKAKEEVKQEDQAAEKNEDENKNEEIDLEGSNINV